MNQIKPDQQGRKQALLAYCSNIYTTEKGIYKYCGSPTYTLGRLTGFGAAISFRSIPLFVASIADLILINLFNYFVEQPFVQRMYLSKQLE